MNRAILIVAHGSREISANKEFLRIVKEYRDRHPGKKITHAFLELARPSISDALESLATSSNEILVLPLFLFKAKHVKKHIPEIIETFHRRRPNVMVTLAEPLGSSPKLLDLLEQRVDKNSLIREFCFYCLWVNTVWKIKKIIFDDNSKLPMLFEWSDYRYFLQNYLWRIVNDYVLLAVIKLHDPAIDRYGNSSLTLEYIIQNGNWKKKTRTRLENLRQKLDKLMQPSKIARHKILAHRDVQTILNEKPLGNFGKKISIPYFKVLQKFVNVVGRESNNGIFPFDTNAMPINDAYSFLGLLIRDTEERFKRGWPEEYKKYLEKNASKNHPI